MKDHDSSKHIQTGSNPVCVACLPGFKPTKSTVLTYALNLCDPISNCDFNTSKTFNRCDMCTGDYALKYESTALDGLSKGLECVQVDNKDQNCIVFNTTSL